MAHRPHRRNEWLHFFFGTPQNFGRTLVGVLVLLLIVAPTAVAILLNYGFNNILLPLLPIVIMIFTVVWGLRMLNPFKSNKKKKDH